MRVPISILTAIIVFLAPPSAHAVNLIANPSAEIAAKGGLVPASWTSNQYGDVKANFGWPKDPFDGQRSLRVQVQATGAEGDARWMSDPITIAAASAADTSIRVSARFRCDVEAKLLVKLTAADPTKSTWRVVALTKPSTQWLLAQGDVEVPKGYTTMQVGFALVAVGTLTSDAYVVEPTPPPPKPQTGVGNAVVNGSLEVADKDDAGKPVGWSFAIWAETTATGTYETGDAAEGGRYARAKVTAVQGDGDGKWWTDPIKVAPETEQWLLTAHWRGTAKTRLMLRIGDAEGKESWRFLRWLNPVAAWTKVQVPVELGPDVAYVRVTFSLAAIGQFDVDDVAMHAPDWGGDASAPLRVSLVITSATGELTDALKTLQDAGVRGTMFMPSKRLGAAGTTKIKALKEAEYTGQEVGAFADDVATWGLEGPGGYRGGVIRAYDEFAKAGLHIQGFVPPDGKIDDGGVDAVDTAGGYVVGLRAAINYRPFDYLDVAVRDVGATTSVETIQKWASAARRHNGWLVLRYAHVGGSGAVSAQRLSDDIDVLKALSAQISPVGEVLNRWSKPKRPTKIVLFRETEDLDATCGAQRVALGSSPALPFAVLCVLAGCVLAARRRRS